MAMSKSETTALAVANELLLLSTTCNLPSESCDFTKGMASAYKAAAQLVLYKLQFGKFSEQLNIREPVKAPTKYQKGKRL